MWKIDYNTECIGVGTLKAGASQGRGTINRRWKGNIVNDAQRDDVKGVVDKEKHTVNPRTEVLLASIRSPHPPGLVSCVWLFFLFLEQCFCLFYLPDFALKLFPLS